METNLLGIAIHTAIILGFSLSLSQRFYFLTLQKLRYSLISLDGFVLYVAFFVLGFPRLAMFSCLLLAES